MRLFVIRAGERRLDLELDGKNSCPSGSQRKLKLVSFGIRIQAIHKQNIPAFTASSVSLYHLFGIILKHKCITFIHLPASTL